mgnify:FL=1
MATSEKLSDGDILKLPTEIDVVGVFFMWLKIYISTTDNRKIQTSSLHFVWFNETSHFALKLILNLFEQLLQATKRHIDLQNIKNSYMLTWPDKLFLSQNFGGCRQSLFRYSGYS